MMAQVYTDTVATRMRRTVAPETRAIGS
jgi:hypothetical protein